MSMITNTVHFAAYLSPSACLSNIGSALLSKTRGVSGGVPRRKFSGCRFNHSPIRENSSIPNDLSILHQDSFIIKHHKRLVVSDIKSGQIVFCEGESRNGLLPAAKKGFELNE